jgi:osmoprotectant transport system ATP-binding protein
LFPHFTVERNIALVPRIENWERSRIENRVRELMDMVGLSWDLASRYPSQLSGGQRQRVGVARALAADPPILILDEAFGALDPITRSEMQKEFRALQQRMQKAVVFVTHDLREALFLGDRIALLEEGHLIADLAVAHFSSSQHPLVRAYVEAFSGSPDSA